MRVFLGVLCVRFVWLFCFVCLFCLSEWRLHEPEAKFEHNFLSHWEVYLLPKFQGWEEERETKYSLSTYYVQTT